MYQYRALCMNFYTAQGTRESKYMEAFENLWARSPSMMEMQDDKPDIIEQVMNYLDLFQ
jgi:hypothetical protein